MNFKKYQIFTLGMFFCFLIYTCTTAPILPDGIIGDPNGNPGQGIPDPCPPGVISFQYEVLPLMISNCAFSGCHDAATAEDDIILDSYTNILKEVDPGDPNNSELYESIIDPDPDDIMPPPGYSPLSLDQKNLVKDWILQGAQNTICGAPCDSTASSFSNDIFPLVKNLCVGCHNSSFTQGDINLEDYNNIIPYVNDGSFLGSIEFVSGYSPMPPSGGKMNPCNIDQIKKWINEGALDN